MSHFIISSNSTFIFGTPKGQASTQLLHAMQRGLRAVCTTPSSVRLIASAGQTSAQVGESQCMQTTGTVCVVRERSTNSRWIIECPLCESHSVQACTHDSQPMQRLGSMKNSMSNGAGMSPPTAEVPVAAHIQASPLSELGPHTPCTPVFSRSGLEPRWSLD